MKGNVLDLKNRGNADPGNVIRGLSDNGNAIYFRQKRPRAVFDRILFIAFCDPSIISRYYWVQSPHKSRRQNRQDVIRGDRGQMGARESILDLRERMGRSIIGQEQVVERLLLTLLCNGNLLLEGLPGLAKTRAVKSLAKNLETDFSRIQFTPDLLPSDITGSEMYLGETESDRFSFQPGPIFANIVLADEVIGRRPRFRPLCWRPWKSDRLPSRLQLTNCRRYSWLWRHRIRSSRKEPTLCLRRRWTGS